MNIRNMLLVLTIMAIPNFISSCGDDDENESNGKGTTTILSVENYNEEYGYFDGTLYYMISSNTELTVTVTKAIYTVRSVEIPKYVKINGTTYRVTKIGGNAFSNCEQLTEVIIPNSVEYIDEGAFRFCINLTSISIPNSATHIGQWAFGDCSNLKTVYISNSVSRIEKDAFINCNNLTKVEFASIEELCRISYSNANANPLSYAHNLYLNGKEVKDIVIPKNVSSISFAAFWGCSGLTSVIISEGTIEIKKAAFYGCSGLTSVTIGNNVSTISTYAFSGCSGLTDVSIPNSVTSVAEKAFYNCSSMKSIYSHIKEPSNCSIKGNAFSTEDNVNYFYRNINIFVPKGTLNAYKAISPWRLCNSIQEGDYTD